MARYDDAAALVRERGWPVFPLKPGEKEPLTPRGFHDATLDLDVVRQWWDRFDDANVGVPTGVESGIVVIDVDDLAALDLLPPMPSTLRLATGRGLHFVYRHPGFEVRNSASRIAPGVDVRGDGGYIVAPGSTHPNGKPYLVVDPSPIAECPDWLIGMLRDERPSRDAPAVLPPSASRERSATAVHPSPYGLAALDAEIESLRLATEGTRNDALNRAAFALYGLVKGGELAQAIVDEALELAARSIGLGERETAKTLRSAFLSAEPRRAPENAEEQALRSDLLGLDPRESPGRILEPETTEPEEPRAVDLLRARLVGVDDLLSMRPPEFLVEDLLVRDTLAVLYGKPGSRKTFLALDWALCVSSGSWWKGCEVGEPGSVLYVAAEGVAGLGRRVRSWSEANRVGVESLGAISWFPQSVSLLGLDQVVLVEELAAEVRFDLIVVDTLARCMVGGDENSALDMGRAVYALDRIRRASGACVLAVHHDTKDGGTPRGSSALIGAADTIVHTLAEGDRTTVSIEKQKDSEAAPDLALYAVPSGESITLERVPQTTTDPRTVVVETLAALRDVEGRSGVSRSVWRKAAAEIGVAESTFYRHVGSLEDEGYVSGSGRGPARIFQTTERGRSWLVGLS